MKNIYQLLKPAVLFFLIFSIICGILYPGIITGFAQLFFPKQANGSIITVTLKDGTSKDFGSELIAQEFTKPVYLIGRPVGVSNLSPVSEQQRKAVEDRMKWLQALDPGNTSPIPADLVMGSGSGVDPNISPEAAEYQVSRIARERNTNVDIIRGIVKRYTTGRLLGIWGNPAVNVLKVNLALDGLL